MTRSWTSALSERQPVRDLEPIRRGALFDVFRARVAGHDVCLKRATTHTDTLTARRALASDWQHSNETNVFCTREMGWHEEEGTPQPEHFETLLRAERQTVNHAATAWNHPGAALVRWGDEGVVTADTPHADGDRVDALALLMPFCEGRGLASFSPAELRRLYPALLPSLWTALTHCPHGDLSLDDLRIDPSGRFFRILDPGASVIGPSKRRSAPIGLDFRSLLFTTNVARHPILMPEFGPQAPKLRSAVGLEDAHILDFRHSVFSANTLADLTAGARRSLLSPHSPQIFPDLSPERLQRVKKRAEAAPPSPAASDTVAMAMMYFTILTQTRFVDVVGGNWPVWSGFWSDRGATVFCALPLTELLDAARSALSVARARRGEVALFEALFTLRIMSLRQLAALAQDALALRG